MIVYSTIGEAHDKHRPMVIARRKAPWQSQKTALLQKIPTPVCATLRNDNRVDLCRRTIVVSAVKFCCHEKMTGG